jgi:hypothetical protein
MKYKLCFRVFCVWDLASCLLGGLHSGIQHACIELGWINSISFEFIYTSPIFHCRCVAVVYTRFLVAWTSLQINDLGGIIPISPPQRPNNTLKYPSRQ